ncbi:IS66 family insertion sequence element accessory protein TnpB [Bacillus paranthracis]|uniref:IS66 family insertion sequence element accessory protein TnpA n=1 Tax=Bacillus paranthracis TaxID=2026186 RepID=UPI003556A5C7
MKGNLLKEEWETYIQNYKNSGLSKVSWCQKQSLPVHRLYYRMNKLSPETEEQNKNERVNWISMNASVVEVNIHATIRIHIQEATIELDVHYTRTTDLPSRCKVLKKVKQTKNNFKINLCYISWIYLTFTL